jgi:HJR/Mrr/RecB family endonuclease
VSIISTVLFIKWLLGKRSCDAKEFKELTNISSQQFFKEKLNYFKEVFSKTDKLTLSFQKS